MISNGAYGLRRRTEVAATLAVVLVAAAALLAYFSFGSGTLKIEIKDPANEWGEAKHVYLNYSAIEIHRADSDNGSGWYTVVKKGSWLNLTRIQDVNQTIGYASLPAGFYDLIRLKVLDARVTVDKNYSVSVPVNKLTVALPKEGIQVKTGQTATLLIEIDVKVMGSKIVGNFRLIPTVKALQT